MRASSITKKMFTGDVYNFTVDNTHLYVAGNVVVSNCHENSTVNGKHGDLSKLDHIVETLTPGIEIAIGGGNALAHPGLLRFLQKLKDRRIIANITINQKHLKEWSGAIVRLLQEELVHGIGISLVDSSDKEELDEICTNIPELYVVSGTLNSEPSILNRPLGNQ